MSYKTEKKNIRERIREKKACFSYNDIIDKSRHVISNLTSLPHFVKAETILLYNSLQDEVCTSELLEDIKKEKKILLPSVNGDELVLHEFNDDSRLNEGAYGIGESDGDICTDYSSIDLAIVPGMAFDRNFNRLGRGKGFYDRLLPRLSCPFVGICFNFQMLEHIPAEIHDIKMNIIVNETQTLLDI